MIMKETHMSWDEIVYKRSWTNIRRMLADSPKVVKATNGGRRKIKGLDELPNRK